MHLEQVKINWERALHAYVLTFQYALRTLLLTCYRALRADVSIASLSADVATCLACSRKESIYSFFSSKMVPSHNSLGPDLSRVFRRKGSSKITISQIKLDFLISLTKNEHFIHIDPIT